MRCLFFCTDVNGLMMELDGTHIPDEWRLFIDSSKTSLKAVLLHNGNEKPSVPKAHAVGMRETHASMELILKMIKYSEHKWKICADLKVVALLLGLQLGYTKHMCFLCLWNSRDDKNHYKTRQWPLKVGHTVGRYNVQHKSVIDSFQVFLPPLQIKLGLMKQFIIAIDRDGNGFQYLKEKFSTLKTEAKIKAGIFIGPEIHKLIHDDIFRTKLSPLERAAWEAFVLVVQNFLGNR
ncbi:hypothetical protein PRIEUP_LOCUS992 [Pristimantis euphronides]